MVQPYLHLNDSGVSVFDLTQPADDEGTRAWADTMGNLITGDQVCVSVCVREREREKEWESVLIYGCVCVCVCVCTLGFV
jgi:isopropylmalate/homocitrate/citramalate synthase